MITQQLEERIVKESIYCICKTQTQNSVFQPSDNLCFENICPGPTMVGRIGTGYRLAIELLYIAESLSMKDMLSKNHISLYKPDNHGYRNRGTQREHVPPSF